MVEKKVSTKESDVTNVGNSHIRDISKTGRVMKQEKICGVVMPISAIEGLSESHWIEVKGIIESSITNAGFSANLVSDADESGIIQKRIIQNLYDNPIVVCDVSCKNPNVMFELGLRLAFDKPTIIIKDDKTDYSFDTSVIEHLVYPRDLRFSQIVKFKTMLSGKIEATFKKSKDSGYSTFLKNFGTFKVAKLDEKEVPAEQFILEKLSSIELKLSNYTANNQENTEFRNYLNHSLKSWNLTENSYKFHVSLEDVSSNINEYISAFEYELLDMNFEKIPGVDSFNLALGPQTLIIDTRFSVNSWKEQTIKVCQEMIAKIVVKLRNQGH